jgi:hypothetical protein
MVEGENSALFIEQVQVNYCKARKDTSDMSHESTHRHTADRDDSHNHKHTGTSAFLKLSELSNFLPQRKMIDTQSSDRLQQEWFIHL